MQVEQLLAEARSIWGNGKMELPEIAVALGVVYGDFCRQARTNNEGGAINDEEIKKELGNIILSTIRWCDDLGYSPNECLELAKGAQRKYSLTKK